MAKNNKLTMGQLAALVAAAARKVDPEANVKLRTASQIGVGLMKREIQRMHAVDTSTMLNSTSAESMGKDTILIGPTVYYAVYVALGTSRLTARPFHVTSATQLRAQLPQIFGSYVEDLGL